MFRASRKTFKKMVKNHRVHFRVSKSQFARIKANAEAEGYISLAAYLRHLALERDLLIDRRIIETNKLVKSMHGVLSKAKVHTPYNSK